MNESLKQFIKFNLVSFSVTLLQLLLANILPLVFDNFLVQIPSFLNNIFYSNDIPRKYLVDNVVTYAYLLPFLLSNLLANIYAYFVNMKATFKTKKTKRTSFIIYFIVLISLILLSTWLQGMIVAKLNFTKLNRTIASLCAGIVQMAILFPLEKYVLFK